jgi:hypothetical protein
LSLLGSFFLSSIFLSPFIAITILSFEVPYFKNFSK